MPGELTTTMTAAAAAAATLVTVLAGGTVSLLVLNTWLLRREEAHWEDWPVDWSEGRRRAAQG